MNMSPVSFNGASAKQLYVARNACIAISNAAKTNPDSIETEDAFIDIFSHGLSMSVTDFHKKETQVDIEDCIEAKITKNWLEELVENNKAKPFLPQGTNHLCERLISLLDKKIEETKQLFKDL